MASGCIHTRQARTKEILQAYRLAVKLAQASKHGKTFRCQKCDGLKLVRVCLECAFVGCLADGKEHSSNSGHNLGVDTSGEGMVYCYECDDYVIDESFEAAVRGSNSTGNNSKVTKVKGGIGTLPPFQATTGLRGFCNMGATCFMSVILQALIHNPLVRNFFLAGGHESSQCDQEYCISCCIDDLFVEFFKSSSIQGYGPTQLIVSSWKQKRALAGGSEQDAHEFLQFVLDEFHKSHFKSSVMARVEDEEDHNTPGSETVDMSCGCVAHRTFCGELESQIKCVDCGKITTTVDPMMDLSLEVKNVTGASRKNGNVATLQQCLDKFTSSERLEALYYCSNCRTRRTVDKQLRLKRLPFALSIQLKRFEHTSAQGTKIETPVRYPLYLDMSKYTSMGGQLDVDRGDDEEDSLNYELFGVVCHQGSINTGHYTCYMKDRYGRWFYFDDAVITLVTPKDALAATSHAYLLFYVIETM